MKVSNKVTLQAVVLSFPSLFSPSLPIGKTSEADQKYMATFLIDKNEQKDLAVAIKKSADFVALSKWGKVPENLEYSCLKDGDQMTGKVKYEGQFFVRSQNKYRPLIAGADGVKLTSIDPDAEKLRSGAIVNAVITLFPWEYLGKKGVSASLDGVQFVREGENMSGGGLNDDYFSPVDPAPSSTSDTDDGEIDDMLSNLG